MGKDNLWQEWLRNSACIGILKKCVLKFRRILNESPAFSANESNLDADELTSEFWVYLATRGNDLSAQLSKLLYKKDFKGLERKLGSMFIYYLKEMNRDPFYKHVRQTLADEQTILYKVKNTFPAYSCGQNQDIAYLSEQIQFLPEYKSLNSPHVRLEHINTRHGICEVACFFWQTVTEILKEEHLIPVRELVRYIRAHYNLQDTFKDPILESDVQTPAESPGQADNLKQVRLQNTQSNFQELEYSYSPERLQMLAKKLMSRFTLKQIKLFCLKYYQALNLSQIADELGFKSPSNISYHLHKLNIEIQDFCSRWPGLSPEDLDENLSAAFMDHLLSFCE